MGVYGLHWTQLVHQYRFSVLFWYLNLILQGEKEPSEPERGAKAHEVRRNAEYRKSIRTLLA